MNDEDTLIETNDDIPDIKHIEYIKRKRSKFRKSKQSLFRPVDIDESTSIKNTKLYNYVVSDNAEASSSDELDNFTASELDYSNQNYQQQHKTQTKDPPKTTMSFGRKKPKTVQKVAAKTLKEALEEAKNTQKELIKTLCDLKSDETRILEEINAKKQEIEQKGFSQNSLAKSYEFFQDFRDQMIALCYCLSEKIPLIEKLADELLDSRKEKKLKLEKYYLEKKGQKEDILRSFQEKKQGIEVRSNNVMGDVIDEIRDIRPLLELFLSMKSRYHNLYCQNHISKTIPSLVVPLFGYFLLTFNSKKSVPLLTSLFLLLRQLDQKMESADATLNESSGIIQKILKFAFFPFYKEIIDFEWDVFSLESSQHFSIFILDFLKIMEDDQEQRNKNDILQMLCCNIFERLKSTLKLLENVQLIDHLELINNFFQVFSFLVQFLLQLELIKKNDKMRKILKTFFGNEYIGDYKKLEKNEVEEKALNLKISINNFLKAIKNS